MKILVTGGAGFIGSHIVDRLLQEGHEPIVVDNLSTGTTGNIPEGVRLYEMDVRDAGIQRVFEDERPEVICHQAAQLDIRVSMRDPVFDADVNVLGSVRLLDCCVRYGVHTFIFASSGGALYGEDHIPASERVTPKPISGYGVAKLSVEQYLYCFHKNYGMHYVALRYANVYGPRQNAHGEAGVIAIFTEKLLSGQPASINGDGNQTRDFVYVGDVVEANMLALRHHASGAYNIGTGIESSINEIYARLAETMHITSPPNYGPAKIGEQQRSALDCTLAASELGWVPGIELGVGLERTVAYFQAVR